jgi:hypothetical protein
MDDIVMQLAKEGLRNRQIKQLRAEGNLRQMQARLEKLVADNDNAIRMIGDPLQEERERKHREHLERRANGAYPF